MKAFIVGAGTDLGVHIDGAHLGPGQLLNDISSFCKVESILLNRDSSIIKSRNLSDRRKNEFEIDKYNTVVYETILEKMKQDYFPILVGGDHSVSVASALASNQIHENIGIIWIDAHTDFNTFESTVTGNIKGMPLAAITGYKCHELRYFHKGETIQASRAVIIGARSIEQTEKDNLRYAGITVFSTEDIKERGITTIMEEAFKIAGNRTNGVHVSYDLDIIDPDVAPGVSVPELDGISEDEAMDITDELIKNMKNIVSIDVVEYNPLRDENRKTEQIAVNILAKLIKAVELKGKVEKKY